MLKNNTERKTKKLESKNRINKAKVAKPAVLKKKEASSNKSKKNKAIQKTSGISSHNKTDIKRSKKLGGIARGQMGELKVIPIGGLNEIGKNMTVFEYNDEIIAVDCGLSFPNSEMPGIDLVIPDFNYLVENRSKVKALIITHGHEDHIGAIPYLLKKLDVPIYSTKLPLALIESKLAEHGISGRLKSIKAGKSFKVGSFSIEAIRATHSIVDSICLYIKTPAGSVFHTGDFKIDFTPVDGEPMNMHRLASIGLEGVDLLMADSTNALRPGFTPSEKVVGNTLDTIFSNAKGRIIIATFSSNVHRIQKIIELAVKYDRKVAFSGRSIEKVVSIAKDLNYFQFPESTYVPLHISSKFPDSEIVIITTGSQGEPMAALSRMAKDEHRNVKLKKGDMVIFSSTPVPGNERTVSNVVNLLYKKEVDVIYSDIADIHVSGHAFQEDLKIIHSLIKPKFFMPVHGEYRHLIGHKRLAEDLRGDEMKDRVFILGNGDELSIKQGKAKLNREKIKIEEILVDGLGVGDVGSLVLKERVQLSEAGLITFVIKLNKLTGEIIDEPEIHTMGFIYVKDSGAFIESTKEKAMQIINKEFNRSSISIDSLKFKFKESMRGYIYSKTKRYPVIIPIIVECFY